MHSPGTRRGELRDLYVLQGQAYTPAVPLHNGIVRTIERRMLDCRRLKSAHMNELPRNILHCIGNTSLLALRNIVPGNGARILLKLESENPTGSMKDRMALAMIEAAEADGRLAAGGSVVEYTGGSTGVSLPSSAR